MAVAFGPGGGRLGLGLLSRGWLIALGAGHLGGKTWEPGVTTVEGQRGRVGRRLRVGKVSQSFRGCDLRDTLGSQDVKLRLRQATLANDCSEPGYRRGCACTNNQFLCPRSKPLKVEIESGD